MKKGGLLLRRKGGEARLVATPASLPRRRVLAARAPIQAARPLRLASARRWRDRPAQSARRLAWRRPAAERVERPAQERGVSREVRIERLRTLVSPGLPMTTGHRPNPGHRLEPHARVHAASGTPAPAAASGTAPRTLPALPARDRRLPHAPGQERVQRLLAMPVPARPAQAAMPAARGPAAPRPRALAARSTPWPTSTRMPEIDRTRHVEPQRALAPPSPAPAPATIRPPTPRLPRGAAHPKSRTSAPPVAPREPAPMQARRPSPWTQPVDLVWRAPAAAIASPPVPPVSTGPASASARPSASTVTAERATTPHATPPQRLDPGLVDRIADDVMRRVERQIRIARERRGL